MIGIYKITNKLTGLSYIGQSIHIEDRWKEHCYNTKNTTPSLIHQTILKYGKENFDFSVLEECEQSKLNERERFWVAYYDTYNNGYNLTPGGGQGVYYDINVIIKDYEQTQNLATTAKNIGCHVNTVRKIIHSLGINHSEMQQEKIIEQIDPITLTVIHTYSSITEAALTLGVDRSAISMAVNGQSKSSSGYFWREQGSNKIFTNSSIKTWKKTVQQIDPITNLILNTYSSCADAAAAVGKDRKNGGSCIAKACRTNRETPLYNFIWKYE